MHNFKVVGTESYKCRGKKSFKRGDAAVTRQDILTLAAFNPVQFFFAGTSLALGVFLPDWFYNGGLSSDSTLGISQSTKQVIWGFLIFAMICCLLAGILSFVYWFLLACRCKNVTSLSVCGTVAGVACVLTMVVIHVHVAISLSNVRLRKYAFAFSLFGTVLSLLAAVGSSVTTGFSIRARKNAAREGHLSERGSPPCRLVSPSPS